MNDAGIVRNRAKITSAVGNAKVFLKVQQEHGSFDRYLGAFTDAAVLSKDLHKRGMRFVGPTIIESFMEATGRLDHHEPGCFRRGRAPRR
jgi:DNA-3-methyladenine glycosylase I